ncbi:hypothetical protein JT140_08135, partial [Helicobacter pylori]|nr:hypothetical protein [Helicobacter pylori]
KQEFYRVPFASHYETFWLEKQFVDQWSLIQDLVSSRSKNRYLLQRDRNRYFLPKEWTSYDEDILTFYSKNIPSQLKSKNFIVFHLR